MKLQREKTARNQEIYRVWKLHGDVLSLEEIGKRVDPCAHLTRERVRQVVRRQEQLEAAERVAS